MNQIIRIYRRNIYGVIGTLVFHIMLIAVFLLADVDMKGSPKEEVLLIEFPNILPEEEKIPEDQMEDLADATNSESDYNQTNTASNRLSKENTTKSAEDFFDDEYLKELEAAKQLASNVNNQLSKEVVDMNDINMPVETTEGMNPDSIKNVIYVGESNIVYYLENRYHISLPIPVYLSQDGGKIVVDIVVNQNGKVLEATPRKNQKIRDEQIFIYAQTAALGTIFNADKTASSKQKGTIHYTFMAQ